MKMPMTCKRCGQGPALSYKKSKHSGEKLFVCGECGGLWKNIEAVLLEPSWRDFEAKELYDADEILKKDKTHQGLGLWSGPGFAYEAAYLQSVGRPNHYTDDLNYEKWTMEEWDKYNEPWINCDAEFNTQREVISE